MDALKNDMKVLLIGALVLLLLIFVIGLFKIVLITAILIVGYFLLRLARPAKQPKEEPPKT